MRKRKLLLAGLVCAVALVFAAQVRGNAEEEVKRLAELMGWKAGTIVADIGAGGVEGGSGETQAGERDCGGEQGGGYEFANGVLRRDFLEARVPSLDQAGGV